MSVAWYSECRTPGDKPSFTSPFPDALILLSSAEHHLLPALTLACTCLLSLQASPQVWEALRQLHRQDLTLSVSVTSAVQNDYLSIAIGKLGASFLSASFGRVSRHRNRSLTCCALDRIHISEHCQDRTWDGTLLPHPSPVRKHVANMSPCGRLLIARNVL